MTEQGTEQNPNHEAEDVGGAFGWDETVLIRMYEEFNAKCEEAARKGEKPCLSRVLKFISELEGTELQKLLMAYQYAETEVTSEIRKRIFG